MFKFLRNLNLALKLNAILILILGTLLASILLILTNRATVLTSSTGQQRIVEEAQVIQQRFLEAEQDVLATANLLAALPNLVAAIDSGDEATVQRIALLQRTPLGLDDIDIVDAQGEYLSTVTEEGVEFDEGQESELFTLSLLGIDATHMNVEGSALLLVGTTPVRNQAGEIVGAILAGRLVDDAFMAALNFDRDNIHIGLVHAGQVVARHDDTSHAEANPTANSEEHLSIDFNDLLDNINIEQALNGQTIAQEQFLFSTGGVAHSVGYTPLTVGGSTEAVIILQASVAELVSFQNQLVNNMTITVVIFALVAVGFFAFFVSRTVTQPIRRLAVAVQEVGAGNLTVTLPLAGNDEVGQLTNSFGTMSAQLQQTLNDLHQREQVLEASVVVSRRFSLIVDENELLTNVVEQMQSSLNYYHAHVYLLDAGGQKLVMAGGTGEAGATLLASGHSIPLGQGLVGRAGATNSVVLVPDLSQEAGWIANPLLPATKASIAVPIAIEDELFGVLNVQHNVANGLQQMDADLIASIANQLAVALQNTRAYKNTQERADQEALINAIGQKVESAATIEGVLDIAARELRQAFGAQRTIVELAARVNNNN